jgi:hypothetical protein
MGFVFFTALAWISRQRLSRMIDWNCCITEDDITLPLYRRVRCSRAAMEFRTLLDVALGRCCRLLGCLIYWAFKLATGKGAWVTGDFKTVCNPWCLVLDGEFDHLLSSVIHPGALVGITMKFEILREVAMFLSVHFTAGWFSPLFGPQAVLQWV